MALMTTPSEGSPPRHPDPVKAALWFLDQGFKAFPVWYPKTSVVCSCPDSPEHPGGAHCPQPGKHPVTKHGFRDATSDPKMVKAFLKNPGTQNYGLVCPPGVIAIDVDGEEGLDRWAALQDTHGPLPVTLTTTTANGRHLFYRVPEDHPKGKMFGFVVRDSESGYVIGPGSKHATGKYYDSLRSEEGRPYPLADLPDRWLKAWAGDPKTGSGPLITTTAPYSAPEIVPEGERYPEITRYSLSLWNKGLSVEAIRGAIERDLAPRFAVEKTDAALQADIDRATKELARKFPRDEAGRPLDSISEPMVEVVSPSGEPQTMPATEVKLADLPESAFPAPLEPAAYDDLAGSVALALAKQTIAAPEGILAALLAFGGAVMGRHALYHGRLPGSPWVALVGDSATGRKTTTMRAVTDALTREGVWGPQGKVKVLGSGSGEGVVGTIRRRIGDPGKGLWWSGLLYATEFGGSLTVLEREGSTLSMVIREGYDGFDLGNSVKAADITVEGHEYQLGALVAITPDELRSLIAKTTSVVNGFANRFLWVPVRQRDGDVDSEIDYRVEPSQEVVLRHALLKRVDREKPMRVEPEAREWLAMYAESMRSEIGDLGLSRRLDLAALRLAVARAAMAGQDDVTLGDVQRSTMLTEYARRGRGWVFGSLVSANAEKVLRALHAEGAQFMTALSMMAFKSKSAGTRLDDALDELLRLGLVVTERVTTGGRPGWRVRLS